MIQAGVLAKVCTVLSVFVVNFCGEYSVLKVWADTTRCQSLRLKCTKFDFHWGCAPDHAGEAYNAPKIRSCIYKGLLQVDVQEG